MTNPKDSARKPRRVISGTERREKFQRVATARVLSAVKAVRALHGLSGSRYRGAMSEGDAAKIVGRLDAEVGELREVLSRPVSEAEDLSFSL